MLLTARVCLVVSIGLWNLKNWARILTLVFVGLPLLLGFRGLVECHQVGRVVRSAADAAVLIYLMLPTLSRVLAQVLVLRSCWNVTQTEFAKFRH